MACLEKVASLQGFINRSQLMAGDKMFAKTSYGQNLLRLAHESEYDLRIR